MGHITMQFKPTATSRSAISNIFGEVLRFGKLVQSYRTYAITFQIIGRSTQIKIVVLGGGLTAPRYVADNPQILLFNINENYK